MTRSVLLSTSVFLAMLLVFPTESQTPEPPGETPISERHRKEGEARRERIRQASQLQLTHKSWAPDLPPSEIDVLHYELDLFLDTQRRVASGIVEIELAAAVDGLTVVELDAGQTMRILGVTLLADESFPYDSARSLAFYHEDDRLSISLQRSLDTGEQLRLLVSYGATGGHESEFGSGLSWLAQSDGTLVVSTISQALAARTWWPCNDRPDDKATVTVQVTAPRHLTVSSNGLRAARQLNIDGTATTRFVSRYPVSTYLVVVNATDYIYSEQTYEALDGSTMPVGLYAYPSLADEAENALANTPEIIAAFAQRFGEYPFVEESYGNSITPYGGGMEHQTLCSLGEIGFRYERLNVHETAHQWWGDWVTYQSWHEVWLSEGFASYSEWLWEEHKDPESITDYALSSDPRGCFIGPVYDNPIPFASTVYDKGAWVLHMLRFVLGDDAFFEGLTLYRANRGGGVASTADLVEAMETAGGMELDWFFEQWVYGSNRPHYQYSWEAAVGPVVRLTVTQVQTNAPPFRMPIEVEVTTAAGAESSLVWLEAELEQTVEIPVSATPMEVVLDPGRRLLADIGLASDPDIELGPEYPGRIDLGVVTNGESVSRMIPMTNVGGSTLTVSSVAPTYSYSGFWVDSPAPFELAPGESSEIEVGYTGSTPASTVGWILVDSNDPSRDGKTYFLVEAVGVWVTEPWVNLLPELSFGNVKVGSFKAMSYDIVNKGGADLIFDLVVSGDGFSLHSVPTGVLAPGETFTVYAQLMPTTVGETTGTLTISTNAPNNLAKEVVLTGTGVAAPALVVDPPALLYGNLTASAQLSLTVANTGDSDLKVAELQTTGPFDLPDAWVLPAVIAPGESRDLVVWFSTEEEGEATGRLRILSNDPAIPWATVPLAARLSTTEEVVSAFPAAARTPGIGGAFWLTTAALLNPGVEELAVDLGFHHGETQGMAPAGLTLSVPPGHLRIVHDVVGAMGTDGVGGIVMDSVGSGLVAISRTFADGGQSGTYGQHINAFAATEAQRGGHQYLLAGLSGNSGFHTNLGLLNLSDKAVSVDFRMIDSDGDELGLVTISAAAGAFAQLTRVIAKLTADQVRGGFALVSCADEDAHYLSYASVVDSGSHDPTFVAPQETIRNGPLAALIPVVALNPGISSTYWQSQMTIVNLGEAPAQVALVFNPAGGEEEVAVEVSVPAGAATHLEDVVGSTLGTSGAGSLSLSSQSGQLFPVSRSFNDNPSGTYGQSVPCLDVSRLATAGDVVVLPGLYSGVGFRTNLGIASVADTVTELTVTVHDEAGEEIGALTVSVPARSLVQVNQILTDKLGYEGWAWAEVTSADSSSVFAAYISVIDGVTGDPVYIPGNRAIGR